MPALKSITLAIEHATLRRDELVKAAAAVERALTHARDQIVQLQGYAQDTDNRWIGSTSRTISPELMRHHYQFVDRLQQAITMQSGVIANTVRQLEQANLVLLQAEVRLMGLKQVLKSRQAVLALNQRRREQRQTDEFAAMQHTRNRAMSTSGDQYDY